MSSSLLLPAVDAAGPVPAGLSDPIGLISSFGGPVPDDDDDGASSESSSIGTLSSDDEDEEEERGSDGPDEADSKSSSKDDGTTTTGSSSLGSLSSLEESLPIKKGLSSHFSGKSRSFSNLSECAGGNAADLVKSENFFNKRRRIQIVSRMSYKRRASYSSLITTALPLLLSPEHALQEAEEEENEDDSDDDDDDERGHPSLPPTPHAGNLYIEKKKKKINKPSLKSPRSFPLLHLRCV